MAEQAIGRVGESGVFIIDKSALIASVGENLPYIINVQCAHGVVTRSVSRREIENLTDNKSLADYIMALAERTREQHHELYKCDCINAYFTVEQF